MWTVPPFLQTITSMDEVVTPDQTCVVAYQRPRGWTRKLVTYFHNVDKAETWPTEPGELIGHYGILGLFHVGRILRCVDKGKQRWYDVLYCVENSTHVAWSAEVVASPLQFRVERHLEGIFTCTLQWHNKSVRDALLSRSEARYTSEQTTLKPVWASEAAEVKSAAKAQRKRAAAKRTAAAAALKAFKPKKKKKAKTCPRLE
jgi:hypothetical protein